MINYNEIWLGLASESPMEAKVSVLGVPFDGGTSQGEGASEAPGKIRDLAALFMTGSTDDWNLIREGVIYDHGDVEVDLDWEATFNRIEDKAYKVMTDENFSLFMGGDHSVTIPLHKAFAKYQKAKNPESKIGIIHFDAHFDLCDNFEGHKWSHANTEKRALDDLITGKDLLFLGIRAAEDEELDVIKNNPDIEVISATDVFENGYKKAFDKIKKRFKNYDAVYFTLDIDVLDPAFAPGTGTPVFGGIQSMELIQLVRLILKDIPVKAMDIVEVSPPLDVNDITSWAAIRIIQEVFSAHNK